MHKRVSDVVNAVNPVTAGGCSLVAQAVSETLLIENNRKATGRIYGGKRTVNRMGEKRGCVCEGV